MKKVKYRINEQGKKRLAIGGAILLLFVVVIAVTQFVRTSETEEAKVYDSEALGQAILKNIEVGEKRAQEQAAAAQAASNQSEVPAVNPEVGDFFNNSLFIGDSRMQGLMIYSGVAATGYTEKGLDVSSAVSKPIIFFEGRRMTVPEALKLGQKFDKIIVKLGMNELGWRSTEMFKEKYSELIRLIKTAQPEAKIYIHGILPVTAKKNADGSVYNNPRIAEFNEIIKAAAAEQGVNYIDVGPMLANAEGFLPEEGAAADGVHLKSDFCKKWLVNIKNAIEAL